MDGQLAADEESALQTELTSVLVVEDEALVAMDVEYMLLEIGFKDIVICNSVECADDALSSREFEFAVFDLNLHGHTSLPLIERLMDSEMRIVVASGYDANSMPLPRDTIPRIMKPYRVHDLRRALLG